MLAYIWIGIVVLLLLGLYLTMNQEGFDNKEARESEVPTDADMDLLAGKIDNNPWPPNVGMTDTVVYAPVDQAADIQAIKQRLNNVEMNLPGNIADTTYQLLSPMVGNVMRQNGFPMTDDTYGCNWPV